MAQLLDITQRRLAQLVKEGVISRLESGRYDPFTVAVSYIRWLRDQRSAPPDAEGDKSAAEAKKNRARITANEADMSDIDREKSIKRICLRSDYRGNYADAIAQGVRNISKLKTLTRVQKDQVFAAIRDVKLAKIEEE